MAVLTAVCLLPAEAEGQCDAVVHDSLPLTEDFEGWNTGVYGPMGECWTRINNGTSFYSGPFVKNLMQYSSELHTYVPNRTMYFHTSVGDEWVVGFRSYLVMPEVEDVRVLTVDFKVRRPDAHPALEVGVMEGTDTSTFVPIAICTPSTYNTFVDYSVPLSGYTGDGGNIAFRTFNVGTYVSEIYLDDIVVWQDSCGAPCCLTASHSEAGSTLRWMAADTTATFLLVLDGTDTAVVSGNSYNGEPAHALFARQQRGLYRHLPDADAGLALPAGFRQCGRADRLAQGRRWPGGAEQEHPRRRDGGVGIQGRRC